jgi:Na+/H+ antiporter NhaD/arsenite permease-like protein
LNSHTVLWLTTILFALTYAGLALGKIPGLRVDRTGIALVGATLMIVFRALTLREAAQAIGYETILLLFGMMIVVAFLRLAGFFERLARAALSRLRGPRILLAVTVGLSGVLSAFLVNDVVCLAMVPLVLHLTRRLGLNPVPYLIGVATAANVGSTATLTGNPQNMIIGGLSHVSYLRFALRLAPGARGHRRPGAQLPRPCPGLSSLPRLPAHGLYPGASGTHRRHRKRRHRPAHAWLLVKSLTVALVAVALFFSGLRVALVALGAAAVLLLGRVRPEKVYRQVDWSLLVMFCGLFVVVHAFEVHVVSGWGIEHWDFLLGHPVSVLSAVSAALSNLVSNVPAVLLFKPIIPAMPAADQETAWLALAMSSTFAGNLTVLGSVANLIVVENAKREGVDVSFWEYCKVGVPLTLLTLGLGIAWLEFARY